MSGHLTVEERGTVALLTLSNPHKRNALDPPMLEALREAVAQLPNARRARRRAHRQGRLLLVGLRHRRAARYAGAGPQPARLRAGGGGRRRAGDRRRAQRTGGGRRLRAGGGLRPAGGPPPRHLDHAAGAVGVDLLYVGTAAFCRTVRRLARPRAVPHRHARRRSARPRVGPHRSRLLRAGRGADGAGAGRVDRARRAAGGAREPGTRSTGWRRRCRRSWPPSWPKRSFAPTPAKMRARPAPPFANSAPPCSEGSEAFSRAARALAGDVLQQIACARCRVVGMQRQRVHQLDRRRLQQ